MVIELSDVQFGLKSKAWLQKFTTANREWSLWSHYLSLNSDQNCTTQIQFAFHFAAISIKVVTCKQYSYISFIVSIRNIVLVISLCILERGNKI
jgi:hypothetical protein